MAVIGKIRKHSVLLVIAIGIAMFAFIAGDFFKNSPQQGGNNIGEINGEEISYYDFSMKVDENVEIEKNNKQKETLTPLETFNVKDATWRQILYQTIMGEEFEKLGLAVSTDELDELIRGQNPHQYIVQIFTNPQTGQFDRERLMGLIEALRMKEVDRETLDWWVGVEKAIREDQKAQKYKSLVENGYYMPNKFAEKIYFEKENKALARLTYLKYHTLPDSLFPVSESELQSYYDKHKSDYDQTESIDLDYVIFDVLPSEEDYAHVEEDSKEIYEEFLTIEDIPSFVNAVSDRRYDSAWYKEGELPVTIEETMFNSPVGTFVEPYFEDNAYHMAKLMDIDYRPDSMKASHLLITYTGAFRAPQNVTRIKVDADQLADSLYQAIKRNPSKFEDLIVEFSDDPSAVQNKGDLGWFADNDNMVYQFNEAVANGKVGEFYLVESPFGYHIIKVTDKLKDVKKVRVAQIQLDVLPSDNTYKDIYSQASVFAGEYNDAEKFQAAVTEQDLAMRSVNRVTKMYNNIPGIDYPREIIRWAYSVNTKKGDVSARPFDLGGKYVVVLIKEHYKEGSIPLEDARIGIENIIRRQKKAAYLMDRMSSVDGDITQIATELDAKLDTVTVSFGSANVPGLGREPKIVAAAFTLGLNKLSPPIEGKTGVYRMIVDELLEAEGAANYDPFVQALFEQYRQQIQTNAPYKALEEEADIVDNRVEFY